MKFLLNLLEILILFVAAYLVATLVWKVFAMIGLVSLSVSIFKNFLFAFFIMLFMFLMRELSLFSLGIVIVGASIIIWILGSISPGSVLITL